MKVIGLTGGIASGKSSIAKILRSLGAAVIDADLIARQIVVPGSPALEEIRATFGEEFITPQGELDRKKMGALVFSDLSAREKLNFITHPRIAQKMSDEAERARGEQNPAAFLEAALLFEAGWHEGLDGVWVVAIPESVQLERLMRRDGYTEEQARIRLASQMSLADKIARATLVLDNTGTPEQTQQLVTDAYHKLLQSEAP
jgi:dephospho-CoA kinase